MKKKMFRKSYRTTLSGSFNALKTFDFCCSTLLTKMLIFYANNVLSVARRPKMRFFFVLMKMAAAMMAQEQVENCLKIVLSRGRGFGPTQKIDGVNVYTFHGVNVYNLKV